MYALPQHYANVVIREYARYMKNLFLRFHWDVLQGGEDS